MPTYRVMEKCFHNGKLYDPKGKRPVLVRTHPFPSVKKKEQVPSSLQRIKDQTAAQKKVQEDAAAEEAKTAASDAEAIAGASFLEAPVAEANTETLGG